MITIVAQDTDMAYGLLEIGKSARVFQMQVEGEHRNRTGTTATAIDQHIARTVSRIIRFARTRLCYQPIKSQHCRGHMRYIVTFAVDKPDFRPSHMNTIGQLHFRHMNIE
ncbi:hypothetical protein FQZ97_1227930 [compost metagenome]